MAKLLLVEDDNNLREIYGARLMAEGFEIVSAADGEEALALAVKEKPDLIISDVMMPKISGFDMLDILRTTPETKDTKVIMMTALSQPEDRARGESLGADRYLVKSQVTLEDVVATVHEVLGDGKGETPAPAPTVVNPDAIGQEDGEVPTAPPTAPEPVSAESLKDSSSTATVSPVVSSPAATLKPEVPTPAPAPAPTPAPTPAPAPAAPTPEPASKKKKTIEPISTPSNEPDIIQLVQEEENREKQTTPGAEITPVPGAESDISETIAEEKQEMEEQIKEFVDTPVATEVSSETEADASETPATEPSVPIEEPAPLPPEPVPTPETGGTVQPEAPVTTPAETPAPAPPKAPNAPNPNDIAL